MCANLAEGDNMVKSCLS